MRETIRVHVVDYGRKSLYLRYRDPLTGKHVAKSAGTIKRKDAEKAAGKWEAELREGRYKPASRVTWDEFRDRYESEKLPGLSDSYGETMQAAMNRLEELNVARLADVDANLLSRFQAHLRAGGVKESTIRTYLKHIKAALSWGKSVKLLHELPEFAMPKGAAAGSRMKGRPITAEEFDRMLGKVRKVRPDDAPVWKRYLRGLWLSGLRLGESLTLTWHDGAFAVDLTGTHPQFRIAAAAQKARRDEYLPITPDFAEWLLRTPEASRTGLVFPMPVNADAVGRVVSTIGEKAGIVVDKAAGKFATAHDLRRSFGTRWSKRVKPATLQRLMRHADIKTTMDFYVQQDADDIAADLWRDHRKGNTSGNIRVGTTGFEPATS